jgi:hypothetical protein
LVVLKNSIEFSPERLLIVCESLSDPSPLQ